jgi:hypothetical protein
VPHARLHAVLVGDYTSAENIEPIYVRLPDAELSRT